VARSGKIVLLVLLFLVFGLLLYGGYIYLNLKRQSEAAAHVQAELDVGYEAQVRQYQRALRIGLARSEVMKYLESGKIVYWQTQREININLGPEPGDGLVCDSGMAYVSLEFSHPGDQAEPTATDILTNVSLKKIGHCS
jgi:hypothetical protein